MIQPERFGVDEPIHFFEIGMKRLLLFPFTSCLEKTNQGTKYFIRDGSVRFTAPNISHSYKVSQAKVSSSSVHEMGCPFPKTGSFFPWHAYGWGRGWLEIFIT